ncbi:MAG: glycosyltransferase N-terminal domain-containing protein [Desulfobacteraceae bacterium]
MKRNKFIIYFLMIYNTVWRLALPFMKRNARLKSGFPKRISASHFKKADIWIQAASAGEAYLGAQLIRAVNPAEPIRVLLTSTTSQGMDILNRELKHNPPPSRLRVQVEWSPFDMPEIIDKAIKQINPAIMVLLETELWPALLFYLKRNRSRIFIINGRLSGKSFKRYRQTGLLWKPLYPDRIYATSDPDKKRFKFLFPDSSVQFMPNIKFDDFATSGQPEAALDNSPESGSCFLVFASVRKEEEKDMEKILNYLGSALPGCIIGIFPRHMHRITAWEKRLGRLNAEWILRSGMSEPPKAGTVVLWDTFGELKKAYAYADAALVGGSFKPLGGQNFIEPAVKGVSTVTGPYLDNFKWVGSEIFETGIVFKTENWKDAADRLIYEIKNPGEREVKTESAIRYILSRQGGTKQAAAEIERYLPGKTP